MTKVSMRHLNEIVRERNQYSRDALEAWQDFINLKGRMDTELGKVTKRNNFLVEELESWKQQVSLACMFTPGSMTDPTNSSSNSKHSPSNSPRRLKSSRSRSRLTSVRTEDLLDSLINKRMMLLVSPPVLLVPRNNVTMLLRHWSCSKRLRRSWSANVRGTRRSSPHLSIRTRRFFDNVMRLNA